MKSFFLSCLLVVLTTTIKAQPNTVVLREANSSVVHTFSSITDAYAAIPATLTQAYRIELMQTYLSATEVFPITFTEKTGASATNTITIALRGNANFSSIWCQTDTSIFVFDGADWIIIDGTATGMFAMSIYYTVANKAPMARFINGATNNKIIETQIAGDIQDSVTNTCIEFGTSSVPQGNSDNLIERCMISGFKTGILSKGSSLYPNIDNRIQTNNIDNYTTVKIDGGTGRMVIDNNILNGAAYADTSIAASISVNNPSDSIFITRNTINMYGYMAAKSNYVSCVETGNAGGANAHVALINNFISYSGAAMTNDTSIIILGDSLQHISGIHITGDLPASIYYNTLELTGATAHPTNGVQSAGLRKDPGGMGSLTIKNNLILNRRTSLGTASRHVTVAIDNSFPSLDIDYNTYNTTTGDIAFYNSTFYNNIPAYQAAIGAGKEIHANDTPISFVRGFQLISTLYNNPGVQGVPIPSITIDKFGDTRNYPYRGADEFIIACTGLPPTGYVSGHNFSTCARDSVNVSVSFYYHLGSMININGHVYQWQWRPFGSSAPFSDILGANQLSVMVKMKGTTEFRLKDSCMGGGVRYSAPWMATYIPAPKADSIIAVHSGLQYDFSVAGAQDVLYYTWEFGIGSGDTSNLPNPQFTFDDLNYTVRLRYANDCGYGYLYHKVWESFSSVAEQSKTANQIHPNPASDRITISTSKTVQAVEVYNMVGTKMICAYEQSDNKVIMDISRLPAGNYIIVTTDSNGISERNKLTKL